MQLARPVETLALPVSRQILRSARDSAVRFDDARAANADERRQAQVLLVGSRDQARQHVDELLHRLFARDTLFIGMSPQLELPDPRLGEVARLFQIELDDASPDVGTADVHADDRVVRFEHPARRQMHGANQAGFVGIVADGHEIDDHLLRFEYHGCTTDGELADPAGAKAAADDDLFRIAPRLELEEAADDEGELLREVLDCALHDPGGLEVSLREKRIELLPTDLAAGLIAERIVAGLAQRLAPAIEDLAERPLTGAVAEQAVLVLQFDVIAFNLDGGEAGSAMRRNARGGRPLIG